MPGQWDRTNETRMHGLVETAMVLAQEAHALCQLVLEDVPGPHSHAAERASAQASEALAAMDEVMIVQGAGEQAYRLALWGLCSTATSLAAAREAYRDALASRHAAP